MKPRRVSALGLARRLVTDVRYLGTMAGYWVRPYDQPLDRRRWRWQPAGRCGYAAMTPEEAAALDAAILARLEQERAPRKPGDDW